MKRYLLAFLTLIPAILFSQRYINLPNKTTIKYDQEFERDAIVYLSDQKNIMDVKQQRYLFFNLDQFDFKLGSTEIDLTYSENQLQNLIEIVKAYKVKKLSILVKTYKGGELKETINFTQKQADALKNDLIKRNINCDVEAIGVGYSLAKIQSIEDVETKGTFDRGVFVNFE